MALENPAFAAHQKLPPDADPNSPESYRGYQGKVYAPDLLCEQALKFIRDNKSRPFFLYFATTVPHLALQVPDDSLAEYQGQWPDTPYPGTNGYLPHIAPRAAYAAMVTRLDRDIGRMLTLLRELGLEQSTICVFTSDNGPLYDRLGGTDTDFFQSAAGLRGRKGSVYEGGLRVPTIVRWPGQIAARRSSSRLTGFEDWMPTLLELIGGSRPPGIDGISFAPTLLGKQQAPRPFLYREFPGYGGQQMVRIGEWKGVRQNIVARSRQAKPGADPLKLELYNLQRDPGETNNVAAAYPDIVVKIERLMQTEHTPSELFPIPLLDTPAKAQ
jgi:arylsulfatase A